ncbi:MAG TPA: flagellar motor protein [Burkholderiaceae bacterium]|jgi:chemotaxis protein MotA
MDIISLIGLVVGIASVIGGQVLEGGHISSLMQPTAMLIVVGGTLGAVALQSPRSTFIAGLKMSLWVFFPPDMHPDTLIERLVYWSQISRKEGMLTLEAELDSLDSVFEKRGLQMVIDGLEAEQFGEALDIEISAYEARMKQAAKIWESAAGYSPTIGILGAVLGLIHVMENLTEPAKLGGGIAVAFVATIYGVGMANLLFLPMAKKLLANIARLVSLREMYVDGLVAIASGEHPRIVESRMRGYFI